MVEEIRYSDIAKNVYDWEVRIELAKEIGRMIGLSEEDLTILLFLLMGNTGESDGESELMSVLKKVRLPKVDAAKYDVEKLKRWLELLRRQLLKFDRMGVLNLAREEIVKKSDNGEYITIYGLQVPILIYSAFLHQLEYNPDYVVSVILGIYESMKKILRFLGVEREK